MITNSEHIIRVQGVLDNMPSKMYVILVVGWQVPSLPLMVLNSVITPWVPLGALEAPAHRWPF